MKGCNVVSVFGKVTPTKSSENEYLLKHYSSNKILPRNIDSSKVLVKHCCEMPTSGCSRSKNVCSMKSK
jgi:hypothetical protein